MIFLLLSILLNAYLGISFTVFKKYEVDLFQAIVFNYAFCVITGSLFMGRFPIDSTSLHQPFLPWAFVMGSLFISVFNLIAFSSLLVGVTITQTANKLSLVIPVLFAVFFLGASLSWVKLTGIGVAMLAVIMVSKKSNQGNEKAIPLWEYSLPIVLFISSGIIDTLTNYVQHTFLLNDVALSNTYLIEGFCAAFLIGIIILLFLYFLRKKTFRFRHVVAGLLLGVPNYFSIYCLVRALQDHTLGSTAIIPINNIGVLFLVSLCGIFFFKERISRINAVGLAFTILAIVLIYFGDKL